MTKTLFPSEFFRLQEAAGLVPEEQGRGKARRGKLVRCARVPSEQVAQVRAAGCIPHAGASSDLVAAY